MDNEDSLDKRELLKPDKMINLYARGAFPMADEFGEIDWYFPQIRTIIQLDNYNIPRSLKKFMKNNEYDIKYSFNPMEVVKNCANRSETWISAELISAYQNLFNLGHLHSVEVYEADELVGGLYGVTFRGAFFGESMFSKKPQTSKIALVKLLERLVEKNFVLLDVQYITPHLAMFGATEISLFDYEFLLNQAYKRFVFF